MNAYYGYNDTRGWARPVLNVLSAARNTRDRDAQNEGENTMGGAGGRESIEGKVARLISRDRFSNFGPGRAARCE